MSDDDQKNGSTTANTNDKTTEDSDDKPKSFKGADPDVPHAQRDGYKWDEERGWVPSK